MARTLHLAYNLKLPSDAVTQKLAFLGISGSGKTFAAGRFVEELTEAGAQVVVVDTVGNWWGLRLAADGAQPGLPFVVFGGDRGDVPLEPTGGTLVADLIAENGASMVLDVSDFTGGELHRFVADFATRLLKVKKKAPSPLMIVWEEVQDVVPQRVMADTARMVGAVEKLVKKGRNYGVGTTLISQRPQAVNKDVLNQVETVFAFRTNGSQERKALGEWMASKNLRNYDLDELPSLSTGTAFVWSPNWLNIFSKHQIDRKKTFDASKTPTFGDKKSVRALAPIDLEKISKSMTETIERTRESDPVALKKRIAELERELAVKKAERVVERVEVRDVKAIASLGALVEQELTTSLRKIREATAMIVDSHKYAMPVPQLVRHADVVKELSAKPGFSKPFVQHKEKHDEGVKRTRPGEDLRKGARTMLVALASMRPKSLTREQVALLSGLSPSSGTFSAYLSDLRKGNYIAEEGSSISITQKGMTVVPDISPPEPTTANLLSLWGSKLRAGARKMLEDLVDIYPAERTRRALGEAVGIVATSGTFSAYLSDLHRSGLIDKRGDVVSASPSLFPARGL